MSPTSIGFIHQKNSHLFVERIKLFRELIHYYRSTTKSNMMR
jgi:hypothetical protein